MNEGLHSDSQSIGHEELKHCKHVQGTYYKAMAMELRCHEDERTTLRKFAKIAKGS